MQLPEVQEEYLQLGECKVSAILDEHTGGKWRIECIAVFLSL